MCLLKTAVFLSKNPDQTTDERRQTAGPPITARKANGQIQDGDKQTPASIVLLLLLLLKVSAGEGGKKKTSASILLLLLPLLQSYKRKERERAKRSMGCLLHEEKNTKQVRTSRPLL